MLKIVVVKMINKIVIISNGHGEDSIAVNLVKAIQKQVQKVILQ